MTVEIRLKTHERLHQMAETFKEKNTKYRDNYLKVGAIMAVLFPNGITLKSERDFILWHWMDWTVGKLTRFVETEMTDVDSAHDCAVYMAMIADYVSQIENEKAGSAS